MFYVLMFRYFQVCICLYLVMQHGAVDGRLKVDHDYLKSRDSLSEHILTYCERAGDHDACLPLEEYKLFRLHAGQIGEITSIDVGLEEKVQMKTSSLKPKVFEIPHFLTDEECDYFIQVAKKIGLEESTTRRDIKDSRVTLMDINNDGKLNKNEWMLTLEDSFDIYLSEEDIENMQKKLELDPDGDGQTSREEMNKITPPDLIKYVENFMKKNPLMRSRHSNQVWIYPDSSTDEVFTKVQERVRKLTKLPEVLIKKSDFQVVNYGKGGHYNAHHDSTSLSTELSCCTREKTNNCRICRYMTVLFYLNDVEGGGGTAFPLAGNETYDEHVLRQSHKINLQLHCSDASLIVQPEKGKAVVWYNHHVDEQTGWMGELDKYTWHGGCPVVRGEKWIANFWIKTTDSKEADLLDTRQIKV